MAWIEKRGKNRMVGWREPDGTLRREKAKDPRDARLKKAAVEKRLLEGSYVSKDDRDQPFLTYLENVFAGDQTLSQRTREEYDRVIRLHLADRFGSVPVGMLTAPRMRRLFAELTAETTAWTAHMAYRMVRRVTRQALAEGLLQRDPLHGVKVATPERKPIKPLTPDEVQALADAIAPRFRCMVLLAAWGGLRIGELGALTPMDLRGDVVTISKALQTPAGGSKVGPPKTASSRRRVTLPSWVAHELREHIVRAEVTTREIFTLENGSLVTHENFQGHWRKACRQAGIEARFHDLRHTAVAILIQQGAHPKLIQSRLGHASITMTMNTYGHLFPTDDADAAARLEQFAPETDEQKVVPIR